MATKGSTAKRRSHAKLPAKANPARITKVAKPRTAKVAKTAKTARTGKPAKPSRVREPTTTDEWLVHADALIEEGNPHGELLVIEEALARNADAATRKRRTALLKKYGSKLKGSIARGVFVVGGGRVGGKTIHERIGDVLLERYSLAHLISFVQMAGGGSVDGATFRKRIGAELPASFHAFYEWARTIAQRFKMTFDAIDIPDDGAFGIDTLERILSSTEMWRGIQLEQPDREWRSGFVHIASWGSAYEMVIDTKGEAFKPSHQLVYWDFKGGSTYGAVFETFEDYLEAVLELITSDSYFKPVADADHDDDDADPFEDEAADGLYETWSGYIHDRKMKYADFT